VIKRKLSLLFFLLLFGSRGVFAVTPDWVREFRVEVLKLSVLAHGESYSKYQDKLDILEKTGKGNCVAWSKKIVKIAIAHKVSYKNYSMEGKPVGGIDPGVYHRVTILVDASGQLWMQTNNKIKMVSGLKDAWKKLAYDFEDEWPNGCRPYREFITKEKDLYDK